MEFDMGELGEANNNADMEHNADNINEIINKPDVKLNVSGLGGADNTNTKHDIGELSRAKNNMDTDFNMDALDKTNKNVDTKHDASWVGLTIMPIQSTIAMC